MKAKHYRRTGDECPVDECEGEILQGDHERFCDSCHAVIDEDTFNSSHNEQTTWEYWWEHRAANYHGFYGDERAKMVGGFTQPYFVGDDSIIEDSILL